MKRRITKILIMSILFIIAIMPFCVVNAKTTDINVKYTIDDFCKSIEKNSTLVYRYIDSNNKELRDTINSRMDSIQDLKFKTKDITEKDGIITVKGTIDAEGDNWNVEGFTVKFDLKKVEDNYIITDTDLFYTISPEHIAKFTGSIVLFVFLIIGAVFLVIATIVIVIVVVIVKNNKKK